MRLTGHTLPSSCTREAVTLRGTLNQHSEEHSVALFSSVSMLLPHKCPKWTELRTQLPKLRADEQLRAGR